jgi:F-type H+-transporting ATPase subunit b
MDLVAVALAAESAVGAAAATPPSPAAALAASFGLNAKLFLAQLLNFGLLVVVLWRFVYRPLTAYMAARAQRIAEGIDNATRYEEKLRALEVERRAVLAQAEDEARGLLAAAAGEAEQLKAAARVAGQQAADELKARAARDTAQEKQQMLVEVRAAAADLVVLAAEKVVRQRFDSQHDQALVRRVLDEAESQAR